MKILIFHIIDIFPNLDGTSQARFKWTDDKLINLIKCLREFDSSYAKYIYIYIYIYIYYIYVIYIYIPYTLSYALLHKDFLVGYINSVAQLLKNEILLLFKCMSLVQFDLFT